MRLHQLEGKGVVACGHRRMGREHRRPAHFIERRLETGAALAQVADALQHGKRGMPLVEVKHGWLYAERLERAHAADAAF